jgi:outer membrane protein insertion porin family|tara:strand:- start:3874 stop:6126 length:2253 start_codon:yes stop_codon:yes gene_type:complete
MIKFLLRIFVLNIFLINSSYSEIIKDLKIIGNKRITEETIKVIGNIDLITDYDDNKLNELSKQLYDSEFFRDISLNFDNSILTITLVENPIIEDIKIDGIKRQSIKDILLEKISLKNRKSFTESSLQNDINLIKNILKSTGYYFVEVSPVISKDDELNSVKIVINIDQGPRAKIKNITFIGDKKIKDKKLLEIVASEEHKFWKFISNNVYLDQSRVNLDKRLIENYYKNLGYYNIEVLSSFVELNKNGHFNLTYNVNAGEYYYFNDLKLTLPENYNVNDFDQIQNYFTKLKGNKYSIDDFNKILLDIEKIASSRLYDFIDAKVDEEIVENNKINFVFNVSDSTKYYVEKINILGNFTTIEEVIRNRLIVDEGDPLNKILYNKSLDNIRSLSIFKNVKGKIKDGSNQNLKEIDISVEEKPTGEISLAAGVGTSGSTIGGGIVERNFLGKGININTNLEVSESSIKGQFIYSKPNFAYSDNTLFTSLKSTSTDNLSDFGYKVSELGFSVGTEFEQYENLFFNPSIRTSLEDLETNASASSALKKQEGQYTDLYFDYGLNYDLRNSKYKPSAGNQTQFFQELPLVSDSKEISNTLIFTQFKKLSKTSDTVGKASIYFKAINSIDSSSDVRISKRGNVPYNRLRGFERGKIGPVDNNDFIGGNYISALNLSTDLPFLLPTVETVDFSLFVDAANVWGVDYDSTIDDKSFIRSSTGIGMNVLTPVGPLSFSLSKPITKKSSDKTETFRFNLGTTF